MQEEKLNKSETYYFGDCELDARRRELRVAGESVTTQPKAFDLLLYLVRNRHRAVDKDELQNQLWPRSIVTETALTRCVMKARRAVNDDAEQQAVIKTVHGHGYRFIADVRADASTGESLDVAATKQAPATTQAAAPRRPRLPTLIAAALVVIATAWWFIATPVRGEIVRLAVLPVENATGEAELDWASTGFMALINRMLEDRSIAVVSGNSVSGLAGGSNFEEVLRKTTGYTHLLATSLERDGDLYKLSFTLSSGDNRPEQRTFVGQEPVKLISQLVDTAAVMLTSGVPAAATQGSISDDDFINEAYARAMSLQSEGRFDEAQRMFQIIIEQDPQLFWPRYEYAICARNLRDFETAERMFIEMREQSEAQGELKRLAAVNNSLGVMYMGRRRNEEARIAFETTVRLAEQIGESRYAGAAQQNLGLLAKNNGDMPLAYEHMMLSVDIFQQLDIQYLPGTLLNNVSGVLIQLGRLGEAEQMSLAAIESFRLTGERLYESYALSRLADIYRRNGRLQEAENAAQSSLAVRAELDDRRGIAASNLTLSDIARERGDLTRALQYAQQAIDIGAEIDDQDIAIEALNTSAQASLALHRPRDALASYTAEEAIARAVDSRQSVFGARYGIARSWIQLGQFDNAAAIADELLTDSRENDRRREENCGFESAGRDFSRQG